MENSFLNEEDYKIVENEHEEVDIEKLIREAGYSNGIFKTQVTLLNRRVGVDSVEGDNLWIHEISPSRTEIRVLPNRAKKKNKDLEKRLGIFLENGTFRDDVIYYVNVFIEGLKVEEILQNFLFTKGTEKDGVDYINLIKKEFNIESFEVLLHRIKTKFTESMKYYVANRNWSINDINYGKPLNKVDCIDLSIPQLSSDTLQSLINCIDFYLPKRDIQKDNILSKEQQITIDKVSQILKTVTSNSIYTSTVPDKVNNRVRGCTDPKALNYNSLAQQNDGSCRYKKIIPPIDIVVEEEEVFLEEEPEIKGCTDSSALNYNPNATSDNGTCKYEGVIESVSKKYYIWSATANIKWKLNGQIQTPVNGKMYDSFNIKHDVGSIKWTNDVREVPKPDKIASTRMYSVKNSNNLPLLTKPYPEYNDIANYYGQNQLGTDSYNNNYGAG